MRKSNAKSFVLKISRRRSWSERVRPSSKRFTLHSVHPLDQRLRLGIVRAGRFIPASAIAKLCESIQRLVAQNALYRSENKELRGALDHEERRKRPARRIHPSHRPVRAVFLSSAAELAVKVKACADQSVDSGRAAAWELAASQVRVRQAAVPVIPPSKLPSIYETLLFIRSMRHCDP